MASPVSHNSSTLTLSRAAGVINSQHTQMEYSRCPGGLLTWHQAVYVIHYAGASATATASPVAALRLVLQSTLSATGAAVKLSRHSSLNHLLSMHIATGMPPAVLVVQAIRQACTDLGHRWHEDAGGTSSHRHHGMASAPPQ